MQLIQKKIVVCLTKFSNNTIANVQVIKRFFNSAIKQGCFNIPSHATASSIYIFISGIFELINQPFLRRLHSQFGSLCEQ